MNSPTNQLINEYLYQKEYKQSEIVNFLTRYLNIDEMKDYYNYTQTSASSHTSWVAKMNSQRDYLLFCDPKCSECKSWINIREDGTCTCSNGHYCTDEIIKYIHTQSKL